MLISLFVKYRIDYIKTNIYNCVNNNHLTEVFFILMRQVKIFKSHRITCNFSLQDKLKWAQLTELDDEHRNIIQSTRVEVVLDKELDWHSSNNTANKKIQTYRVVVFCGSSLGIVDSRLSLQSTMISDLSFAVVSVQVHDFGQALDPPTAAITNATNSNSL